MADVLIDLLAPDDVSVIVNTPARVPCAVGANVTVIVQFEVAASIAGQL